MANHSSIVAWEIPWTEEPDGLQSLGSQVVGHYLLETPPPSILRVHYIQFKNHTAHHVRRHAVSRHSCHLLIYFLVLHLKAGCFFFFFTKSNKRQIYIKDGKETQLIWDLTCSSDKVIIAKNATPASFLYFVSLKTAKGFQVYWHLLHCIVLAEN